jgi:hypothetical protein
MPLSNSSKTLLSAVVALVALGTVISLVHAHKPANSVASAKSEACPNDDGGLTLPAGFCATIFADGIGHARHMVAGPSGVLYVNTWSGRYYGNDKPHEGGFLVALQDKSGSGKADVNERFGGTVQSGDRGGTGIGIYKESLFAETNDRIVRYSLPANGLVPSGSADTIVSGLPLGGDHPMHPFLIDPEGKMYVDVATATNACQQKNRTPHSPGINPCTELETRGGVWLYDANKTNQTFSPSDRFATGIRNAEGFAINSSERVFVTQHGRDQLYTNWPELYKPDQEATLPAEEVLLLKKDGVLLRRLPRKTRSRAGIWRRRGQKNRRMRRQERSRCSFPRALGTECHGALRQNRISGALSRRSFHCLPRLLESRALRARRLQRGLSAARWRPRLRPVRGFCGWLRGPSEVAGQSRASARWPSRWTRRFALRFG